MERKKIKVPDPPTGGYGAATSVFSLLSEIPPMQLATPLPRESPNEDDAIKTDHNVRATPLGTVRPRKVSLSDSYDKAPLFAQKKPAANEPAQKEKSFLRCYDSSAEDENEVPLSPRPLTQSSDQVENALRQNATKGDVPPRKDALFGGVPVSGDVNERALASEPIVTRNIVGEYQHDCRSA